MTPRTNNLLSVAAQTGVITGNWFAVPNNEKEHLMASVNLTVGTGTIVLEGRIDALSPATTITTFTASDSILLAHFRQMRFKVTAATGLTAVCQVSRPSKDTGS